MTQTGAAPHRILSIDIGGSGVKAIVIDQKGRPLTERTRMETPRPATPAAILRTIDRLAAAQRPFDRISLGFPGVIRKGVAYTAYNLHDRWVGFDIAAALRKRLHKPARVANDADIQGMGAVRGRGVELVLTLGTGLGSALFLDGRLVPNLEVAHHPFHKGLTYEEWLGKAGYDELGVKHWNRMLARAVAELEHLFNYDWLYLGGGNAKKVSLQGLPPNVKVVPNVLGLLGGAALWRK